MLKTYFFQLYCGVITIFCCYIFIKKYNNLKMFYNRREERHEIEIVRKKNTNFDGRMKNNSIYFFALSLCRVRWQQIPRKQQISRNQTICNFSKSCNVLRHLKLSENLRKLLTFRPSVNVSIISPTKFQSRI